MARFLRPLLLLCLLAAFVPVRTASALPGGRRSVDVLVPEAQNLEALPFWVALGGGYFTREGLDVRVVLPDSPSHLRTAFVNGAAPVAVLTGPEYERLIADGFPFVVAANLLQNDPHVLIIRHEVANRLGLHDRMPVRRRLDALRGVSIGVAALDRVHLYQVFHSEGLDANLADIQIRKGDELLSEFAFGKLDAIYAATPYAERVLADNDGVVLVSPAAGEVAQFSERMFEALGITRAFLSARPEDAQRLVRALARAERAIHHEPALAVKGILEALPKLDAKRVTKLVSLYARAVPPAPHVEAQLIKREASFYPAGGPPLDLSAVNLDAFVLAGGDAVGVGKDSGAPSGSGSHTSFVALLAILLALGIAAVFLFLDQRDGESAHSAARSTP
jgi:ABC-type nitrate/sulfonate/bicarbonate transport system substrate-binding protein